MYEGFDLEVSRYGGPNYPMHQDRPGVSTTWSFGGPHAGGCQFVLGDGSVRFISYSIEGDIHFRLANRKDGLPIDASAF